MHKYYENKKRVVLKKNVRIIIIFILLLFAAFSFCLIYTFYNTKQIIIRKYHYDIDKQLNYKVYLKENNFYEEKYLEEDKQYNAELIDYINTNINYVYTGSDLGNFHYEYDIDAVIIGEYENSKSKTPEIWKKKYKIIDNQTGSVTSKTGFNIIQSVKLDYDEYNKVVTNYKETFKLAITARLNVKMTVSYKGELIESGEKIEGKEVLEMNIPLTRTTVVIDKKVPEKTSRDIDLDYKSPNRTILYIGYIMGALDALVFIIFFNKIFVFEKNPYKKKLNKILKDYSEITVRIANELNLDDKEIIEIDDFNNMLDLENEFNSPIMVFETVENKETWFVIVNEKYAYRYILNIFNAEK